MGALLRIASGLGDYGWDGSPAPVEAPLPELEVGEPVWRPGYGWVQPVVVPEVEPVEVPRRESAVAA